MPVRPRHTKPPDGLRRITTLSIRLIAWTDGLAHLLISVALILATLMFIWLFLEDVGSAVTSHNLAHGFLNALGTLMLLWTVSALVMAEARYLRGHPLSVDVFVEVALVVAVRKLITLPVQDTTPPISEVLTWTGAVVGLAVAYGVVHWVRRGGAQGDGITEEAET